MGLSLPETLIVFAVGMIAAFALRLPMGVEVFLVIGTTGCLVEWLMKKKQS
jgi:hypothetical protein